MKTFLCLEKTIDYDGRQLAPHFIYQEMGIEGNALVAFIGNADVTLDHMVDLEDVKKKAPIYSPKMLHFLGEWFIDSLDVTILYQHLLANEVYETLLEKNSQNFLKRGNDIYYKERKLNVSIATKSIVSGLIHLGINIDTEGTPVPTAGLNELGVDALEFAETILKRFEINYRIWKRARTKVLPR